MGQKISTQSGGRKTTTWRIGPFYAKKTKRSTGSRPSNFSRPASSFGGSSFGGSSFGGSSFGGSSHSCTPVIVLG